MFKRVKNAPLLIALFFIALAGIGFYNILQGARNTVSVAVAKENLAAYTFVKASSFDFKDVPKDAVTASVLTEDEYNSTYVRDGKDLGTSLTYPFLAGQWIFEEGIAASPESSFAVVRENERVVAATTTATGAALFTIRAGDVVDVTGGQDGFASAENVKVICIAGKASGCSNVVPDGASLDSGGSSSDGVQLLLAVPAESASDIAGQSVSLVLNPFCGVDRQGNFINRDVGNSSGSCSAATGYSTP